jgi:hypothetical protein
MNKKNEGQRRKSKKDMCNEKERETEEKKSLKERLFSPCVELFPHIPLPPTPCSFERGQVLVF